ncbi:MAG: hypothetical protein EOO43_21230 [Flavobacterium sp.]|nr:MAG: hypothetical protein EOO43_21230 [Flavobacterium sp.]
MSDTFNFFTEECMSSTAKEADIFIHQMIEEMESCESNWDEFMVMFRDVIMWNLHLSDKKYIKPTRALDYLLIIEKMRVIDPQRAHKTCEDILEIRNQLRKN